MSDPVQTNDNQTQPGKSAFADSANVAINRPIAIGRYRVERLLGKGGFGLVFLAHDQQLDRPVAIKVPHSHRVARATDAEAYLIEARTVANLDHPNIVPVHDVGSTEQFPCYIVSKFIEGSDLATRLKTSRPTFAESANLAAIVAEALHYAHGRGLVHRDIKPGNILLDASGKPYVVDFGLALKEDDVDKADGYAGTPAYMSPEQARGEGHRVDGRSDIFSLGVVLYELITGRRPFGGKTYWEVLDCVKSLEARPPRQFSDAIPKELERICLKALSKRATERYTTAHDLADDLRHFLARATETERAAFGLTIPGDKSTVETPQFTPALTRDLESRPLQVVPKGLRSFDEHDADFFLELLPGPRDREGLPDSIRFWKTRIEEPDADKTFSVGLIYGPSGCGKSSLVKAGLLPRLSDQVIDVYVEATSDQTKTRLLNGLRKRCPDLPGNLDLKDTLGSLRRGQGILAGEKVLFILDQFEQWLHATTGAQDTELLEALRQCDGGRVQCIVMVRDDFWMAATRFMRELEIRLVEGQNSAAVDLFPIRHAEKVLLAFGQAFGVLPQSASQLGKDQRAFLTQSVAGLAEEDKVNSVRLALFAEMMKGKAWTPAALKDAGGAKGVGVAFLEETFSASTAPPEHRYHQEAIRAVLKALLPASGVDIKGERKSIDELLQASGYAGRPRDFHDLITILDSEVRLITPTDPQALRTQDSSASAAGAPHMFYQLTHDYLVYPLREWLTGKQKATRRGRAELQLDERAAAWSAKPENRQLPSLWEYIHILGLTSRTKWTQTQRRMMVAAGRHYGLRSAIGCLAILVLVFGIAALRHYSWQAQEQTRVEAIIDQLLVADIGELPRIAASLEPGSDYSVSRLEAIADDSMNEPSSRLRAAFVLADKKGRRASQLIEQAAFADHPTIEIIRSRFAPFAESLSGELWNALREEGSTLSSQLRLASLLASADPSGDQWAEVAPSVVHALLSDDTLNLDAWTELLRPAASHIIPELSTRFADASTASTEHTGAARVLARYADAQLLADLIVEADPSQFATLFSGTTRKADAVTPLVRKIIKAEPDRSEDAARRQRRLRNATVALLRLGSWSDLDTQLSVTGDPTVRTMFVLELRDFGVPPENLLEAHDKLNDPTARQAVLLGLDRFRGREFAPQSEARLMALLQKLLVEGRSPPERSAAEWLLRRRGAEQAIANAYSQIARADAQSAGGLRDLGFVNSEGHAMCVIRGPIRFTMGSPAEEAGREANEPLVEVTLPRSFAMAAHEVTTEQFRRFEPTASFALNVPGESRGPANRVSLVLAMQYCRWLSEQEHVADDQMCYPPQDAIEAKHVLLSDERLARTGYRLPTEAEWECACRAGTTTVWFFGNNQQHLEAFGWYSLNTNSRPQPVGKLMPNPWGLFDMVGNMSEWCQPVGKEQAFVLRGGNFQNPPSRTRSARRYTQSPTAYSFTGFRVARTIADHQ